MTDFQSYMAVILIVTIMAIWRVTYIAIIVVKTVYPDRGKKDQ
jgi:hypothetical protein